MIFAIASYHRPECRTVRTLLEAGVSKNDIVVALQDEADIPLYKANYPGIRFIYRKADCAAANRNTLLDEIKERPICLLDDDIVSFCYRFENRMFRTDTKKSLDIIFDFSKKIAGNNCSLAGISPTNNNILAKNRPEISVDNLLQGSVLIFFTPDLRFDERFKMVEDYELSLRVIYSGQHLLRENYVCANKPKNGTNAGGLHDRYARGELPFWLNILHKKYPMFKVNKNKTGGDIVWTR